MKRNRRKDEELEFDAEDGLPAWSTAIFGRERDLEPRAKPPCLRQCSFTTCPDCHPPEYINGHLRKDDCITCNGLGYINPPLDDDTFEQTEPGSEARVVMLAARYAAGLDLWSGAERPRPQPPEPLYVMDGIVSKVFRQRRRPA